MKIPVSSQKNEKKISAKKPIHCDNFIFSNLLNLDPYHKTTTAQILTNALAGWRYITNGDRNPMEVRYKQTPVKATSLLQF